MARAGVLSADFSELETPAYVVDLGALKENLQTLARVQTASGAKILLALKGFAMFSVFPLIREYLAGVCSSSLHETELGRYEFNREVHAYAPAFAERDLRRIVELADHVIFNSLAQWQRFRPIVEAARRSGRSIEVGLRVNPEHSEVEVPLYDPCAPCSRLGVTEAAVRSADLDGINGLHFHNLCQKGADALERTLRSFTERFGFCFPRLNWVNFGGGHHITRPDYDTQALIQLISEFRRAHGLSVYLEPGEAVALDAGVLVASVLDIVDNGMQVAVLDTSATAHMPDVLEMPYRPELLGAGAPGEHPHLYRLGGLSCLAGDVIGDYTFPRPLEIGDRLVFTDMAHYTMVKNTTFNGVRLPDIATYDPTTRHFEVVRRFGYADYRSRLS